MKQKHPKTLKWLAGIAVSLFGWFILVISLYYGIMIFYVQERVLFIFPSIAQKVSFQELINDPEKFDGCWIRVEGQIWRRQMNKAFLVSPNIGSEVITDQEYISSHKVEQVKPSSNMTLKPLPDDSFFMHNFSIRICEPLMSSK